ncbi:MAG: tRNA 2-thiouridine(34) synthase MnmA [Candidatus Omnitrophica bacterium]|nr:tRNA 2-thiouridine(34) synthase MnmA [Candidatus Omnitrophota bacterium]MBU4478736.1 tRNA 2-thiouridine(34) synthase MnmA [Candidatus Omnitrophota bacterium]MCG2703197.1 tRNA 2-thiouridine(34) synthase MnmA [Candidatus Omnitrophota bacterium]
MKKRVLIAMSGGVDSSVAAYLLKESGYEAVGVTMCLGIGDSRDDDGTPRCCGSNAIADARQVCAQLNMAHYVLDFSRELERFVVDDFVAEYSAGRTPNPCIRCNEYLKFGKLLNYAKELRFDFLATGHYAKIDYSQKGYNLCRPKDRKKDQTYFLYRIKKADLAAVLFPLADYTKEEVRRIARQAQLAVAAKPQSQDICFIIGTDYKEFLVNKAGNVPGGDIVTTAGDIVGRHNGIINYTRGQRGGLGIAAKEPLYVIDIDAKNNRVIIGSKKEIPSNFVAVKMFNRLADDFPAKSKAMIRYRHTPAACRIKILDNDKAEAVFDEPQEAVTPGQSIVFYNDDIVLGGGLIETARMRR